MNAQRWERDRQRGKRRRKKEGGRQAEREGVRNDYLSFKINSQVSAKSSANQRVEGGGTREGTRREEVAEDNMLMPRRRLHGNLRGSMCSTRFVRRIRYYNVFYTSSRRLDPRKLVERARRGWIKLNFRIYTSFLSNHDLQLGQAFSLYYDITIFQEKKKERKTEDKNLYEKWRIILQLP